MQQRRVAVRGIIYLAGKLFVVRLSNYKDTQLAPNDFWCTPGGGLDLGEPLSEGLEREMVEETGVKPVISKLLYVQQFPHQHTEHLEFFFLITNAEDYHQVNLANTSHGSQEIVEFGFKQPETIKLLPEFLAQRDIAKDIQQNSTLVLNYL